MAGFGKEILARSIQLADRVIKNADSAQFFEQECLELKTKAEKLAALLHRAARASTELFKRPTPRIIDYTEQVLDEALTLVFKCRPTGCLMRILFITIPSDAFEKTSIQLENSIHNVSWLLRVSTPAEDHDYKYFGVPPITSDEPILYLIWEQIAILHTGALEDRFDAAVTLGSLARGSDRYGGLIIEEGGVGPLLKLAKEEVMEGQENAARSIGFLCVNSKSAEQIVNCGACSVFAKILENGHMKVQSLVALAISEMAIHYPKCQDDFVKNNVISLLIDHLAFETIQIPNEDTNTKGHSDLEADHQTIARPQHASLSGAYEDPATKVQMKVMAARALWYLCKGNVTICRNITESRALLCFALLLENGHEDVKYYSAMALTEITAMAEQNVDLRLSGFKPTSPVVKTIVEQFLKIVENENIGLIIPSIKAIGHLAWTFKATETRMIAALVRLLDDRVVDVTMEAVSALDKFARPDNFGHEDHCRAMIEAGGTRQLVQLVYFGEYMVKIASMILLCHLVLHVPDSEVLAQEEVLTVLEVSSKNGWFMEQPNIQSVLPRAKNRLKLYQSQGSTWISMILFQKESPR